MNVTYLVDQGMWYWDAHNSANVHRAAAETGLTVDALLKLRDAAETGLPEIDPADPRDFPPPSVA